MLNTNVLLFTRSYLGGDFFIIILFLAIALMVYNQSEFDLVSSQSP
ncbi:hypothetical protein [Anabaena sp. CCY 9402-a]